MNLTARLVPAAALIAAGLSAVPAAAEPTPVLGCGSVVTTSVTLTADITGCTGDGLVVGRDGITIDLGYYTISGAGLPDQATPGTAGIRIEKHDRVTITGAVTDPFALKNNEIVGFETAVLLGNGADQNTLTQLNLRGSRFGVALRRATENRIEANSIAFAGGERPEPCEAGRDAEAGIAVFNSAGNTIRGNTSQLSMFGILLHHSDGNTIAANEAAPLWSDGNQCDGIALFASHNNRVVDNTAANDVPHGIRVAPGSHGNVVRGNVVFQNGGDGILVSNKATTLEYNQATRNQGWGINAVRGVTASGNRAAENFGPGQCRNVTCEPATPPV